MLRRRTLSSRILAAVTLAMLFLLASNGLVWCKSCSASGMDCCAGRDSSVRRITTKSCCVFRIGGLPGAHPSLGARGTLTVPASPDAAQVESAAGPADTLVLEPPEPQLSPPRIETPPLFILNSALLR